MHQIQRGNCIVGIDSRPEASRLRGARSICGGTFVAALVLAQDRVLTAKIIAATLNRRVWRPSRRFPLRAPASYLSEKSAYRALSGSSR